MTGWADEQVVAFCETHSAADFEDDLEQVALEVKPSIKEQITFKLSGEDVQVITAIAHKQGIGHTTLMRMWIKQKLESIAS